LSVRVQVPVPESASLLSGSDQEQVTTKVASRAALAILYLARDCGDGLPVDSQVGSSSDFGPGSLTGEGLSQMEDGWLCRSASPDHSTRPLALWLSHLSGHCSGSLDGMDGLPSTAPAIQAVTTCRSAAIRRRRCLPRKLSLDVRTATARNRRSHQTLAPHLNSPW
jgi:hypothetical protein